MHTLGVQGNYLQSSKSEVYREIATIATKVPGAPHTIAFLEAYSITGSVSSHLLCPNC